ncbi:MAG: stage II sporulation protein D [Firmicutes bacterium]|nr:stage II sporulation protein D [Bacillota bacterium]
MKKIIITTFIILLVPFLIVSIFVRQNSIHFEFKKNTIVRVKREKTGAIEQVPFENYVVGVLAGEMPTTFPMEALKAQAVAARTYVMRKMEYAKEQDYDIVDTVSNQVYYNEEELKTRWKNDYDEKMNRIKKAVLETKGEYLSYQGQIAQAFFFSTSTGYTENCEEVFQESLPYLKSVKSDWEKEVSPVFEDGKTFTLTEFYQKLNLDYNQTLSVEVTAKTSTGRVKKIKINGKELTGNDVYKALGIRSTYFDIKQNGEEVIVSTKGFGHGVGMSQYGAYGMAKQGADYQKILKYYYQGIDIKKIE